MIKIEEAKKIIFKTEKIKKIHDQNRKKLKKLIIRTD